MNSVRLVDESMGLIPPPNHRFGGLQLMVGLNPPLIDSDECILTSDFFFNSGINTTAKLGLYRMDLRSVISHHLT